MTVASRSLPPWLKRRLPAGEPWRATEEVLAELRLSTVCREAACPNRHECYSAGTATFMILGTICTRHCTFCAVESGTPAPADDEEPARVAEAVDRMGLSHVVVTCVTRDDLPDGGAAAFVATIGAIRSRADATIEVLTSDFAGDLAAAGTVFAARPDVYNHNVETVERLYPTIRPEADYRRSLSLLRRATTAGLLTKSGLMLGVGETRREITTVLTDLREAGCRLLTLGQYLAPSVLHHPVERFLEPSEFAEIAREAEGLGFDAVASEPFVRSSYRAGEMLRDAAD